MARVLVTGMSGAGKTTLLEELGRRGHLTVDTDHDGWTWPDGTWDEARMDALLADQHDLVVSGTVGDQGRFYDRFDHVRRARRAANRRGARRRRRAARGTG